MNYRANRMLFNAFGLHANSCLEQRPDARTFVTQRPNATHLHPLLKTLSQFGNHFCQQHFY